MVPEWSDYADFCEAYERGVRQQAFIHLERFIVRLEGGPFAERRTMHKSKEERLVYQRRR